MTVERRSVTGNRPLLLTDPDRLWRVAEGAVDLFLVRSKDGRPAGARHPLGRVETGGLLAPFPPTDGWTVLAAGTLDTQVLGIGWDQAGEPRQAVERRQREILAEGIARVEAEGRRHRERLERLREADRRRVANALGGLVDVMERHAESTPAADDPLLAACRLVGDHLGLAVRRSAEPRPETARSSGAAGARAVEEIARASGIRSRQVLLEGRWWRSDAGPLLGFRGEDGAPVALLPRRGRYRAIDPARGEERVVDQAFARELDSAAITFYRTFPHHPLRARHLFRFGAFGLGRDLGMVVLMGLLGGALGLLPPIALEQLVDTVIPGAERGQLVQIVGVLVAAALGSAMFALVRSVATVRVESHMDASVQAAVWDRVLGLPIPFFQRFNAGDLANRAMGINAIRQVVSGTTATSLLAGIFSLLNLGLMLHYSPRLTLVAVAIVLAMVLATLGIGYLDLRFQRRISDLGGRLAGKALQLVKAIAKLRGAGAENRGFAYWAEDFARQRRLVYRARLTRAALATVTATAPVLASLVLFGVYALGAGRGTLTLSSGGFLAFIAAFGALSTASLHTGSTVVDVLRVVPIYERAQPILQSVPEGADERTDVGTLDGEIEVARVSFRYHEDGPEVLSDVSLRARPGESIAVVGPSGAGKSTLLRLLLGFDEPTSGAIYYDSCHLTDLDPRSVRRQIGVVLQGGQLLGGDIFGNIVGALPLGMDDAWAAARMAGLEADIRAMPMGMNTLIGEGGSTLSGGQRQRLMIAKALVSRPRIVLFDEATSALDNPTQAVVSDSLEQLQATRILIAHRLSTIRLVDRIYVLDAGRISESGSYDELMAANGAFAELARRQIA